MGHDSELPKYFQDALGHLKCQRALRAFDLVIHVCQVYGYPKNHKSTAIHNFHSCSAQLGVVCYV